MDAILSLLIIGLICLAAEIVVPGGILGIIGLLLLLAMSVTVWIQFGAQYGLLSLLGSMLLAGLLILLELYFLKRSPLGKRFFLTQRTETTAQGPLPEENEIVGQAGETMTVLAPGGLVVINGQRYEALSQSGMLARGTPVVVVGRDAFRIVVRAAESTAT